MKENSAGGGNQLHSRGFAAVSEGGREEEEVVEEGDMGREAESSAHLSKAVWPVLLQHSRGPARTRCPCV